MGGRGSLSKTPSREPPRASKNQAARTAAVRFLTPRAGRVVSAWTTMLSFRAVSAKSCIYNNQREKKGDLRLRVRHSQLPSRFVEQGSSFVAQEFFRLLLGLLPGRDRPLQQPPSLGGQAERLRPGVLAGHDFQPALGPHPLDVAAERGRIQLEDVADLGGLGHAELRRD